MIVLLLATWVAHAASLLEATQGVVGRGVEVPTGAEAAAAAVDARAWDDAATHWAVVAEDGNPVGALWWIVSLVRADRAAEAERAVIHSMERHPGDPRIYLLAAWTLYEAGAPKESEKIARGLPEFHPDHVGATILRIRSLVAMGEPRKALRMRARAARVGDTDAWFWLEAGMQDSWLRRPDATAMLARALRTEGTVPAHYLALMHVFSDQGQVEQAVTIGHAGVARFPDDQQLVLALGEVLMGGSGRPGEALDVLADHVERHPEHALAWRTMARAYVLLGDGDEAVRAIRRAIDAGASEPALFEILARALQEGGDPEGAVEVLEDGLQKNPNDPEILDDLFEATDGIGDPARVLEMAERLEMTGQLSPEMAQKTFDVATETDRPDVALHWAEVFVTLVGETARSLSMRALALASLGRSQEALEDYEAALALGDDDPWVLNNFSWFLLEPGAGVDPDPDRAVALASRAVELSDPVVPARLDTLARAYFEIGETQRAVETQRRAVALAPTDPALQRTLDRYERAAARDGHDDRERGMGRDGHRAPTEGRDASKPPR